MVMSVNGMVISTVPTARQQVSIPALQMPLGEFGVSEIMPRLYALGWSGQIFSASNQAAQAVSVALATTYTGIGIYNPVGSGKIIVPLKVKFALSVAPAAVATIGFIGSFSATGGVTTQTTKLVVQSGQIGSSAVGIGIPLSAATITTPTWVEHLEDGFTAAALPAPTPPLYLDGHISALPGAFIGIGALTAVTGLGSIFWAELPI
jgi:hypothetical protein